MSQGVFVPEDVMETDLGTERRCGKCREWWPLDREFYHLYSSGFRGFNSVCRACRNPHGKARFDEAEILAMLRAGRRVPDIAAVVGASEGAVYKRQKAYRERAA